jgi:hypothetical protein
VERQEGPAPAAPVAVAEAKTADGDKAIARDTGTGHPPDYAASPRVVGTTPL